MSPEQMERISWLFEEALSLPPAELPAFLDRECPSDPDVRREIERLLSVNREMEDGFLEQPATSWLNPSQLRPGDHVGRYLVEDRLGAGGMSVVYRAFDSAIGRRVALKLLMPFGDERESGSRLFAELRALGALKLDGVVQVFDFGEFQGMPYIVMECLEGEDLSKAIRGGRCGDSSRKLDIARQIASALKDVHAARIVHRDIKPANVFLQPNGRVKLMDFGMAREDRPPGAQISVLMGTPEFISPEQIKGEQASFRSDIYSYGILLYELFSGSRPFKGQTAALLNHTLNDPLPVHPLLSAGVPDAAIRLIAKAAAKEPALRFDSFTSILEALKSIDTNPSPTRPAHRNWRRTGLATVAAAAALSGIFVYFRASQPRLPSQQPPIEHSQARESAGPARPGSNAPVEMKQPVTNSGPAGTGAELNQSPAKSVEPQPEKDRAAFRIPNSQPQPPGRIPSPVLIDPPPAALGPGDPSGGPAPDIARVLTALSPVTSPKNEPPHADQRKAIQDLLDRYSAAWQQQNLSEVVALDPHVPLPEIKSIFSRGSKVSFQLTMLGEPQFSTTDPLTARFNCRRFLKVEYPGGRPPVVDQTVAVVVERIDGAWKFRAITRNQR